MFDAQEAQEGDLFILDDVKEDDPHFGAVFVWGKVQYEAGPRVYRKLIETKLRVIK